MRCEYGVICRLTAHEVNHANGTFASENCLGLPDQRNEVVSTKMSILPKTSAKEEDLLNLHGTVHLRVHAFP